MWSKPWSYKEGLVIGAGLLVIGILLQMAVGAINWSLFACPVNVIVLMVYIIALVTMHLLRKRVYLFGWLSHYSAAVSSLIWVVGMTVIMGLIRQAPSGHASNDMDGHCIGIDYTPCQLSIQDWQTILSSQSRRIVRGIDYGYFGKC